MSSTSGVSSSSSATSGTLGNAAPVSFPGISSGIDYNSIIEKYTADTLQQEKPTIAQVNNLNSQNAAILKIKNLIGGVQDSLTALSNPTTFNAFKATAANTASGSPAATATQINGQTPIAGTYTINAQTIATATTVTNNTLTANAAVNANVPLAAAGTSITPTNGTGTSGLFTINGVQIKYDVTTNSLNTIVNKIQAALTATTGGTATLLPNGELQLTGVQSLGSGGDSGNLEQVLKLDTAQLDSLNLNGTLASQNVLTPINFAGTPGITITTGSGPTTVNYTAGETLQQLVTAINAVPGATATASATGITISGATSIADAGGGNLIEALGLTTPDTSTSAQLTGLDPTALLSADTQISVPVTAGTLTVTTTSGPSSFAYNPATDSLNTVIGQLNAIAGVHAAFTNGQLTITGVTALADSGGGNLTTALGLSTPTSTATAQLSSVTSSAPVGGINEYSTLASTGNGFATAVTAGTFTINGVQFTINPTTDSLSDVIGKINASTAGVTATYNQETSQIQLTSSTAGPQSILLGATGDVSNFLTAAGLTTAAGATTTSGTQASLTYTNSQGTKTVYSATNDFTSVIPGIDLNINASSPASLAPGSTYYTVNVTADPTQAEAAIGKFITAYNAAITELNKDTVAPTVTAGSDASTGSSQSSSSGGGILYGNFQISGLRDQLVQLVSGFVPSGSSAYNSLQSVGILLDTNSQSVGTASDSNDSSTSSSDTAGANNSLTVNATSGQLQALDTTTFEAAYAANTSAIQALFTATPKLTGGNNPQPVAGSLYGFSYQLGSQLANIDGLTTFLQNSVVTPDNLSNVLLSTITDSNNQQIDSLEQQIAIINQEATQQADSLRSQFTASETQIAQLQALQSQIAAIGH